VSDLNELIQEILDFRKIEESKFEADNIRKISISNIMSRHLESFIPIAEQNKVQLDSSIPENLEWNTDISCFNRIFVNLISNAFKYTEEGGKVNVSVDIENEKLILKVRNTGKGIDESKIPDIFDRYRILEDIENNSPYSQMTSRNGIGLSICHSMVKLLQGEIEVKSEVNQFAEFIVYLPALTITIQTNSESQQRDNTESRVGAFSPERSEDASKQTILIVDDNKDIVWLITDILSDRYIIKGANNVEEALKVLEIQTPALIITDIMMPNIDGLEFINRIKANKFTKHIPLIIISAKISDKEHAEGLNTGADAYLTKPFSPIVLQSLVNRLLVTKEELKEYYYSPESAYKYADGQLIHQEDKDFMESVISIINENIEKENLRELIADKLGINTRNLYRRFKKITSLPPNDFIKDYRFTLAAKLLITTSFTIQEVIYKVGITNKSYFYREFFKKYNMTPKEYRSGNSDSTPQ
jgi:Signal transduction histidine kinase